MRGGEGRGGEGRGEFNSVAWDGFRHCTYHSNVAKLVSSSDCVVVKDT